MFNLFCASGEIPQILTGVLLGIPVAIAMAEATAAPFLALLEGIPVVGHFLHLAAHAAIVSPFATLEAELTTLLAMGPDANLGQQLANVLNQLMTMPAIGPFPRGKAVIPAIVDTLAGSLREQSEHLQTKESYRSYTKTVTFIVRNDSTRPAWLETRPLPT